MEIANFEDQILNSVGLTVVDFWAPWCGPCMMFKPIFEEVSKDMTDINFYKLNVDNNKDITKKLGIMSIPTIILFKDGKEAKRNIGILSKEELKKFLEKI